LLQKTLEIIVEKGELAQAEQILLLPQLFLLYQRNIFPLRLSFDCRMHFVSNWEIPNYVVW